MYRSALRATAMTGLAICTVAVAVGAQTATQANPDLSGTWTLDVKRSDNPFTSDASKIVIEQTESELTRRSAKDHGRVERYRLDGSESVNAESDGTKSKSTARWDGAKLIVTSAVTPLTTHGYTRTTTYSVTSGGKELIIETATVSAADKSLHFKQVWVRQDK